MLNFERPRLEGVAYPQWFRERVLASGGTPAEQSARFGLHISTIYRFRAILRETGSVARAPARGGTPPKTTAEQDATIATLTRLRPDVTVAEVQRVLRDTGGPELSPSSISVRWKKMGFTRKRLRVFAQQRDEQRRVSFWQVGPEHPIGMSGVAGVPPMQLIDVDECGMVIQDVERRSGHALQGERAIMPGRVCIQVVRFVGSDTARVRNSTPEAPFDSTSFWPLTC